MMRGTRERPWEWTEQKSAYIETVFVKAKAAREGGFCVGLCFCCEQCEDLSSPDDISIHEILLIEEL